MLLLYITRHANTICFCIFDFRKTIKNKTTFLCFWIQSLSLVELWFISCCLGGLVNSQLRIAQHYNWKKCFIIIPYVWPLQLLNSMFSCSCVSLASVWDVWLEVSCMQMLTEVDRLIIGSGAVWQLWALPGVEIDEGWLHCWGCPMQRESAFVSVCVLCLLLSFCVCQKRWHTDSSQAVSLAAQAS